MPFTSGGNEGFLNGMTAVEVVGAPTINGVTRLVREIIICNLDSVNIALSLVLYDGSNEYPIVDKGKTVSVNKVERWQGILALDTSKLIRAYMGGAVTTTAPSFTGYYVDES